MRIFDATNTTQFGFGAAQTVTGGIAGFKNTMNAAAQGTTGGFNAGG